MSGCKGFDSPDMAVRRIGGGAASSSLPSSPSAACLEACAVALLFVLQNEKKLFHVNEPQRHGTIDLPHLFTI